MSEQKRTILIVDDVPLNRTMLRLILEDRYHVLEADNGITAKRQLDAAPGTVSLILLDMSMPVMDGYQMLDEAKKRNLLGGIPIIAITAEDDTVGRSLMTSVSARSSQSPLSPMLSLRGSPT